MYSFKWREHDPTIGRFWQIDPLADQYVYNSPYAFSENRVVNGVEMEGLEFMGMGYLVDAAAQGLSDLGLNRTAGFVSTYGHSLFLDPAYSTANAVKTASTGDVNATVKAFDPTGITSIPDIITTVGNAASGDEYAQRQVLGMVPAIIGGFKAVKIGIAPEAGPKIEPESPVLDESVAKATNVQQSSKVAKSKTIESKGEFTKTTKVVPSKKSPGQSRAEYVNYKNKEGKTIRSYKDSYDRANNFQHRKPTRNDPEGRRGNE